MIENLLKKSGMVFIIKILGLGLGFLFQIILTNSLDASIYGKYTIFLTYLNMITIFSLMGLDNSLIKEIPRIKRAQGEKIFKFFLKIVIISTIVISIIFNFYYKEQEMAIFIMFASFIKVFSGLIDGYLQGKEKVVKVNVYTILVNNILKIIFFILLKKYQLMGLLISFFLSEIICLGLRIKSLKIKINIENKIKLTKDEKKRLIYYGVTFTLISSIGVLNENIDKLILEKYMGYQSVGIYKVSQNYVSLLSIFVSPFVAFWPMISKLYMQNKIKEIENNFSRIVSLILIFNIPTFIFILKNADSLLGIFGEEYIGYGTILIILSLGSLIDSTSGPIGAVLTMTKYQKITLYNSVFCLILNIILDILLIKNYGLIGVALATTISLIVNNLISILCNKIYLNNFPYNMKNIGVGLINLLILLIINNNVISKIVINNIVFELFIKITTLFFISIVVNALFYRKDLILFLKLKKEGIK